LTRKLSVCLCAFSPLHLLNNAGFPDAENAPTEVAV
jgi:hypothetical protein